MQDIYALINSRQIAEHCRKIRHPFTVFEQAVLIDHAGQQVPIEERISLYQALEKDADAPEEVREAIRRTVAGYETAMARTGKRQTGVIYYTDELHFSSFARARKHIRTKQTPRMDGASFDEKGEVSYAIHETALDDKETEETSLYSYFFNGDGHLYNYMDDAPNAHPFLDEDIFIPTPFENGDFLTWREPLMGRKWGVYAKSENQPEHAARYTFEKVEGATAAFSVYTWDDMCAGGRLLKLGRISPLSQSGIFAYRESHLPKGCLSGNNNKDEYRRLVMEYLSLRTRAFAYGYPEFESDPLLPSRFVETGVGLSGLAAYLEEAWGK